MKNTIAASVAVATLFALFGAGPALGAYTVCVSITGAQQGQFKGDAVGKNCTGTVGYKFDYVVSSPRDAATGMATGRRMHGPVKITKEWSPSSLALFQALTQNELLSVIKFDFYTVDRLTGQESVEHSIVLRNAFVTSIAYSSDASKTTAPTSLPAQETVEFVFQQIELIDLRIKGSVVDTAGAAK
jgi:type VI secretion system secreted protein Hcp